jgi:hypothetical protein
MVTCSEGKPDRAGLSARRKPALTGRETAANKTLRRRGWFPPEKENFFSGTDALQTAAGASAVERR